MAVSLDGVMVLDKEAQKKAKAVREAESKRTRPKLESGPAGYKEVGCGTVSLYAPADETPQASDEDDERGPRRLSTIRYARAPEYKKKSLTEQLDAEVRSILGPCPDIQLVVLADGAEENWRYFSDRSGTERSRS